MAKSPDEGYREAEVRIRTALREQSKRFNLNALGLAELPDSLGDLTHLQKLELSDNQLTTLPEWLGQLTQLQSLSITNNQLTGLPKGLTHLAQLKALYLGANRLAALPEWLGQLTMLETLYVWNNGLTKLPEGLGQLTQLQELDLRGNELTKLPEWLGQLTQLQGLDLSDNRFTTLPEGLAQLTQLKLLALSRNQLTTLPEGLGHLTKLLYLYVRDNQLTKLPESLNRLRELEQLFLHGNPALGLSEEILGPTSEQSTRERNFADPRAILAYYFGQRQKPLNEVKLLLVGYGRVGKTSLSKALRGISHDEQEPETPGIERHSLKLKVARSIITAHIWDFGGQEFLHQTHQFFFSKRSIYVVVLTGRQGRPMQEAEYWLRLIRTYGTGSPVVIALNQVRAHPFSVDEYFLQENYPEVKAVVRTDCDPRVGIDQLTRLLGKMAGRMPSVREKIDPSWTRVRNRLEEMQATFVTFAEYRNICTAEGIGVAEKQETLATILDCLGIALNYRDDPRLRDTSVLKPRWLVDGIYEILRWLHKHETGGTLRIEDFSKALKSKKAYPPSMHAFLLALMEKFELCFPLEGEDGAYLVPGLLDENQPRELKEFMGSESRRIQFRYDDVRPPGLLPRFIVRSHTLSEKEPRWLRGVVLARGKARALVRGDHEGRVTDVFALGDDVEDRVWLTEFILSEMRVLNDQLPVRTFVGSEDQPGAWTELELLRDADRNNEGTRTERGAGGQTVLVDVKQTLREVESAEASAPGEDPLPLFICYAHADERVVKQLIPGLKVLAMRGYVEPWRDTDLVPGENWDETIKERLSRAQVILFMVSQDFLASDYITHQERPLVMELVDEKKAAVVPVILSDCSHDAEDFARFENLPRKGKAVSSYNPRATAWALVEAGIRTAVEKQRSQFERSTGARHRL